MQEADDGNAFAIAEDGLGNKRTATAAGVAAGSLPRKKTKTDAVAKPECFVNVANDDCISTSTAIAPPEIPKTLRTEPLLPKTRKTGGRPKKDDQPSWEHYYFRLGVFKQKNGHCRVPTTSDHGKTKKDSLFQWVLHQRSKQGFATLTHDQKAALDALGFVWDPRVDEFNRQWDERFAELVAYKEKHGTTLVPVKEEKGLGKWVAAQRDAHTLYVKKQSGQLQKDIDSGKVKPPRKCRVMSDEHYWKLKSINFVFSIYTPGGGWDAKYEKLKEYRAKYGDCRVPQHWKENKGLGKFVSRQRYLYCLWEQGKFENNPLTQERIDKLKALGFCWGSTRPMTWKDPQSEAAKRKAEEAPARANNGTQNRTLE